MPSSDHCEWDSHFDLTVCRAWTAQCMRWTLRQYIMPLPKAHAFADTAYSYHITGKAPLLQSRARSMATRLQAPPPRPGPSDTKSRQLRRLESKRNVFVRIARHAHKSMTKRQELLSFTRPFADSRPARVALGLHARLQVFTTGPYFVNFFLFAIVVNSVLLAMEHANMSESLRQTLETANVVFTWLFTVEFVLLLASYGVVHFFASLSRSFDAAVVLVSLIEVLSASGKSGVSALRSLKTFRVLKSLRVLRVVRAFKYLRALSMISEVLGNSVTSFSAIGMLLALFLLVFAIIGLQIYGQADLDIGFPNFHTFFGSLVIVFQVCPGILPVIMTVGYQACSCQASAQASRHVQVMTSEDWQTLMMSTIRATDSSAVFFFLVWILVSRYVFLMLFLAVAMEAFERSYQEMEPELSKIDVAPVVDVDIAPAKDPDEAQRTLFASMAAAFNSEAEFRKSVILSAGHGMLHGQAALRASHDATGAAEEGPVQGAAVGPALTQVPGLDLSRVAVAPGGRVADPHSSGAGLQEHELTSSRSGSASRSTRERRTDSSGFAEFGYAGPVAESHRDDSMTLHEADEQAIDAWLAPSAGAAADSSLGCQKTPPPSFPGHDEAANSGLPPESQGGFLHRLMQGDVALSPGGAHSQASRGDATPRLHTSLGGHEAEQLPGVGASSSSMRVPGLHAAGHAPQQTAASGGLKIAGTRSSSEHPEFLGPLENQYDSRSVAGARDATGSDTVLGASGKGEALGCTEELLDEGGHRSTGGTALGQAGADDVTAHAVRKVLVGHALDDPGANDHNQSAAATVSRTEAVAALVPLAMLPVPDIAHEGSYADGPVRLESLLTASPPVRFGLRLGSSWHVTAQIPVSVPACIPIIVCCDCECKSQWCLAKSKCY